MNHFDLIDPAFALRLTTTLMHFLWQGCVVALLAMLGELLLNRAEARWRYLLHLVALVLMVACVPVTFALVHVPIPAATASVKPVFVEPVSEPGDRGPDDIATVAMPSVVPIPFKEITLGLPEAPPATSVSANVVALPEARPADSGQPRRWLPSAAPYVTLLYFACCGALLVRLVQGIWSAHRLRRRSVLVDDVSLIELLRTQCRELGLRVLPAMAWCAEVSVPVVIGVLKPMILLPTAAATGLSPEQLQTLITHELAHIRRYDLLADLMQRLAEALLCFHPAVWFISRRLSNEREQACDELVLGTGCERLRYADALVRMAELSTTLRNGTSSTPATSLAAAGANSSEFKRRVLKVLAAPISSQSRPVRVILLRTGSVWLAGTVTLGLVLTIALGMIVTSQAEADPRKADRNTEALDVAVSDFKTLLDHLDIGTNHVDDEVAPRGVAAKTIRGELLTADGQPVPNAKIVLLRGERYWNELYRSNLAITDSAGKFVIRGEPEMYQLAIEVGSSVWAMDLSHNQSDVVVRLPKLIEVALKLDRQFELEGHLIELEAMDRVEGQVFLRRRVPGTFDLAGVAKVSVPVGRYLAFGSKRLNPDDAKPLWGWCALGEVTVDAKQTPETLVRRLTGSRISGQVKNLEELLKNANADYAEVSVSVAVERHGDWQEFTFDSVLCEADGSFRAGPVPVGRARVRVDARDRPGQERPFRQQPRLMQQRLALSRRLEVVELPPSVGELSVADRIAAILDSEGPLNVSWSHTDVQVASLGLLPEKTEVTRELIRLMNDPQTPDNWQYVVIEALGRTKPVSAEAKSALLAGAKNPKLRRRASMLLALGNMRADAAGLIDEIITFKDSPNVALRGSAISALGDIGKSLPNVPASVGDTLIAALDDPVIHIRKDVAGSLAMQKAAQAVPALRSHLRSDPNGSVRAVCAWAIFHITDEVDESVPVLIELLDSDDHKARMEAAYYLQFFDVRAKAAIPALEANATFIGKPPFKNSHESRRYQLTSAAQNAIRKITADKEARKETHQQAEEFSWGPTMNGLRARVVPVSSAMKEDTVDLTQRVAEFETLDDVGLAVEIENVSDKPVSFRDLRYGTNYGDSSGKLASDWFGQFLFSIDYFDADGKPISRPELMLVDQEFGMSDAALTSMLQPKQTVKPEASARANAPRNLEPVDLSASRFGEAFVLADASG